LEQFVTIELLGSPFKFKVDTDVAKAQEVADYLVKEVDKVELQLSKKYNKINQNAILILSALNIAGEYMEYKKKYTDLVENLYSRSARLVSKIEHK